MANGVVAHSPSVFADGANPSFRQSKRGEMIVYGGTRYGARILTGAGVTAEVDIEIVYEE